MNDLFISVRGRVLVNVEALNMTESVGNYVKHRRVPVLLPEAGYVNYFVPAISGESIAHGFQRVLAENASQSGVPLCKLCGKGIFLKSTGTDVFREAFGEEPPSDPNEFEKFVVVNCFVEDVGGFLYAPRVVKRTSNFYVGYMIPVKESLEAVVIEPQMHSRYALGTRFVEREERGEEERREERREEVRGQMLYYVELSSATYTFSFDLDTRYIGKLSFQYEHAGELAVENTDQRHRRVELVLDSLNSFVTEFMFGAKKTRFLPVVEWESIAISVSKNVWTLPASNTKNYLNNALSKLEVNLKGNPQLFVYVNPEFVEDTETYLSKTTQEMVQTLRKIADEWEAGIKERFPEHEGQINIKEIVRQKVERLISQKMDEVIYGGSLRYASTVKKAYEKFKQRWESSDKKDRVKIFDSFEETVSNAVEYAKQVLRS